MLTQADRLYFQTRLEHALDDVLRALETAAANDNGTVILDQSSVGRLSRMDALQQQAMAAGWKETLVREKRRPGGSLDSTGRRVVRDLLPM